MKNNRISIPKKINLFRYVSIALYYSSSNGKKVSDSFNVPIFRLLQNLNEITVVSKKLNS